MPQQCSGAWSTLVLYSVDVRSHASAMTIPARVVPASVAMMAPLMVPISGNSWNQMPCSISGGMY